MNEGTDKEKRQKLMDEVTELADQMSSEDQQEVITMILTTVLYNSPRDNWPTILTRVSRVALDIAAVTTFKEEQSKIII